MTAPDRYANYWKWTSKLAKVATGGMCCYPKCRRRARQTHHAAYLRKDERGRLVPIRGTEKPGVDAFPLCLRHHSKRCLDGAHHPRNWVAGVIEPDRLDAVQKPEYYKLLVEGFKEKSALAQAAQNRKLFRSVANPKPRKEKAQKPNSVSL